MMLWKRISELSITKRLILAAGAVLETRNADGSTSTVDLSELAALDSIAASDLAKIDGITNGTVSAGKAVVVDSNKDASAFRNVGVVNLDAGASGTAGSVDVFPPTASKGKLTMTCADQTGDTAVSVVAGAMAAARTLTIRDPGAAASFLTTTDATAAATTATAAEITMACDHSANVETVTATNVITAAESGKTFFLDSTTEFESQLPAPSAGLRYTFIVAGAPSGASYTVVTASSTNIIKGHILASDLNSETDADSETSGGDTISFVDGVAVAGDRVDLISDGTNWYATGKCVAYNAITITTAS
jgi:hypothetical protein